MRKLIYAISLWVVAICPITLFGQTPSSTEFQQSQRSSVFFTQQKGAILCFQVVGDDAHIVADVYALSGKHIARVLNKVVSQGDYSFGPFAGCNLPQQAYIIRLSNGIEAEFIRMINLGKGPASGALQIAHASSSAKLAKVTADTAVVLFYFPKTYPNRSIAVKKMYDPSSGKAWITTDNPDISSMADLDSIRELENIDADSKYGASRGLLRQKLGAMENDDTVKAIIHLKMPHVEYLDKTKYPVEKLREQSLAIAALEPITSVENVQHKYFLQKAEKIDNKTIMCTLNRQELEDLLFDSDIGAIEEFIPQQPCDFIVPFSKLATEAWMTSSLPSDSRGNNVHAATFENGLTQTFVNCRGNLNSANIDFVGTADIHTLWCFTCLWNSAPSAVFYHKNMWNYYSSDAQNWIINKGIQTISLSYPRGYQDQNTSEFLVMDDFAFRYPYPVFCNPAANDGNVAEVNWQCYNAISIGSEKHQNENYYVVDDWSCAKNPEPVYGPTLPGSTSGDREMPYLLAPGSHPYELEGTWDPTCKWSDNCLLPYFAARGTSFSAPTANGVAACLISANTGEYVNWPEKVRATLLVTSQNVDGDYWSRLVDGKDGAGAISATNAVYFAKNHNSGSSIYPYEDGIAVGIAYPSSSGTIASYKVKIKNPKPSGKHLRCVLTWDSNPDVTNYRNWLSDFDLTLTDASNNLAGTSLSWDSNIEMFDVTSGLTAGATYNLNVVVYTMRIPAGARAQYTYYSVAWTWVKDHAD
jgi:hypothetical protein